MKYQNLFFIPARKGSKGLKNKNIKKIGGKTLLELAILDAKRFARKDNYIFVSTDSSKYLKICVKTKVKTPFLRSKKNSNDNSNIVDAVIEFLKKTRDRYENVIILQPTSPLRKINLFKKKLILLNKNKFNTLVSVKNLFRNQNYIFQMNKNNTLDVKKPIIENPNRQNAKLFTPCGSFYATKTHLLLKNKSLFNPPIFGIETKFPFNIDIDNQLDLKVANYLKK